MNLFPRPIFLLIVFLLISFASCARQPTAALMEVTNQEHEMKEENKVEKLTNIIFYLSDDQDIYDYGCYGNDKIQTPAVDRLAKEGMLFKNAFTGQAICAPSRAQLFSGKYPLKNGCFKNHTGSRRDLKTATKYMRELGYEVVLAGKSHVKPATVYDWDQVFPAVDKIGTPRKHVPIEDLKNYFADTDHPFCLFITSYYPHGKYFEDDSKKAEDIMFYPFNQKQKDKPDFIKKKSGYYRSVLEDNKDLEEVLNLVDQHLDENTLFLYSADHGVSGKFTVYDRGLNVPFIARWPKVIKAGSQSDVLIHYTDVLPTLMELAGGTPSDDFDGKSFLSVLKGNKEEIHEYVYGVSTSQNIIATAMFPSRMIRSKKYKYIRNFNALEVVEQNLGTNKHINAFIRMGAKKFKHLPFEELYDVEKDPFEQNNLAKQAMYQMIKEKLSTGMFKWMKTQGDFLPETPGFMPVLKADNFQLDQEKRGRKIPDSLKNTLSRADYFYLPFEKINPPAGRVAIIADGNSPDPDDLGGTAVSLALLRAAGLEDRLVHYSHSCDLFKNQPNISVREERERHALMQASCDVTARRWGGFDGLTFYDAKWQQDETITDLANAINASTADDPLWIIEAGEPDIIGLALSVTPKEKHQYVKVITHHPANDNAGDFYTWQQILDFGIEEVRIPDQNTHLKVDIEKWDWARDHPDDRIQQVWLQGKIAEIDNVVKFQEGKWDCSDAGMVLYWITGATNGGLREGTVDDVKGILLDFVSRNPEK